MDNNKFTMSENIVYPTVDDLVEIEVLNNNTRLLDENKADINHVHEQYVTKDEIAGVTTDLTEIKNTLLKIQQSSENWQNLPNLESKRVVRSVTANEGKVYKTITQNSGKGTLICAVQQTDFDTNTTNACIKIEIDGQVILDIEKTHTISDQKYRYFNYLGIINAQNLEIVPQANNEYLAQYNTTFLNEGTISSGVKPLVSIQFSPYIERAYEFSTRKISFTRASDVQRNIGTCSGKIINLSGIKFNESFKISTYFDHDSSDGARSEIVQFIYSIDN